MKYTAIAIAMLSLTACQEVVRSPKQPPTASAVNEPRKLRYVLDPTHCGMLGFFNDGSVAGVPDSIVSKNMIAALDTAEVFAHYRIEDHYIVFTDDSSSSLDFNGDVLNGYSWVMVDYKWRIEVPE